MLSRRAPAARNPVGQTLPYAVTQVTTTFASSTPCVNGKAQAIDRPVHHNQLEPMRWMNVGDTYRPRYNSESSRLRDWSQRYPRGHVAAVDLASSSLVCANDVRTRQCH